jgi:hypothetical protein
MRFKKNIQKTTHIKLLLILNEFYHTYPYFMIGILKKSQK